MVRVVLWIHPRCCSTAFERCVAQIPGCSAYHEPFRNAYHYGPDRKGIRYPDSPINEDYTHENVLKQLAADTSEHVFVKDCARFITEHDTSILLDERWRNFKHVFLMRHPKPATVSFYKLSNDEMIGWNYFEKTEMTYRQLHKLYLFVKENLDARPLLLRTEDLQVDPQSFLKRFCSATGLPYSDLLTSFQPHSGVCQQFNPGWHMTSVRSDGFKSSTVAEVQATNRLDLKQFPLVVQEAYDYNLPFYEMLCKYETRIHDFII